MVKIEIRGILKSISPTETTKANVPYIKAQIVKPPFTNEFGETKGNEQVYEATFFGDSCDGLIGLAEGEKVVANCLLKSEPREYQGKTYLTPEIIGRSIQKIGA